MTSQEKLNKAWELKKEADKLEKEVADFYRNDIVKLCREGKEDEARDLLRELEWHESIHKFDLLRVIRINCA